MSEMVMAVEAAAGVGAPTGWLGGEVVVSPIRPLVLHGGGGAGTQGLQVTAGARVRIPVQKLESLMVGVSWSRGPYAAVPDQGVPLPEMGVKRPVVFYWSNAQLANADLSYEVRASPWVFRPFVGIGYVMNGDAGVLVNGPSSGSRDSARWLPYLGFAVSFEAVR